jgi:hypothetical protein
MNLGQKPWRKRYQPNIVKELFENKIASAYSSMFAGVEYMRVARDYCKVSVYVQVLKVPNGRAWQQKPRTGKSCLLLGDRRNF